MSGWLPLSLTYSIDLIGYSFISFVSLSIEAAALSLVSVRFDESPGGESTIRTPDFDSDSQIRTPDSGHTDRRCH